LSRASGADNEKPLRTPAAWMMLLYYPIHPTPNAFGVDDGLDLVPSPVSDMGHFNQAPLGQSYQAPKHRREFATGRRSFCTRTRHTLLQGGYHPG